MGEWMSGQEKEGVMEQKEDERMKQIK